MNSSRWASRGALHLALGILGCAWPVVVSASNIRPFVEAGYTRPLAFDDYRDGWGLSGGLEFEQTHRTSAIIRVDWSELSRGLDLADGWYDLTYSGRILQQALTGSIGARFHLLRHGRVRPYVEGRWGVRLQQRKGRGCPSSVMSFHNSGVTLGVNVEALIDDPEHFALATARLGFVFP